MLLEQYDGGGIRQAFRLQPTFRRGDLGSLVRHGIKGWNEIGRFQRVLWRWIRKYFTPKIFATFVTHITQHFICWTEHAQERDTCRVNKRWKSVWTERVSACLTLPRSSSYVRAQLNNETLPTLPTFSSAVTTVFRESFSGTTRSQKSFLGSSRKVWV